MVRPFDDAALLKLRSGQYVPCSQIHDSSCEVNALKRIFLTLPKALKVYLPVHVLSLVLFKMKDLRNRPKEATVKFLIGVGRSIAFAAVYMSLERLGECYLAVFLRGFIPVSPVLITLVAANAIYLETSHRRMELSLHLLPQALETLWNLAKSANYVRPLPYGEIGVFMVGLGLMLSMYECEKSYLPRSYSSFLDKLLDS